VREVSQTSDPGVPAIYYAASVLFEDEPGSARPENWPRVRRRILARCVLFLKSSREYEWQSGELTGSGISFWQVLIVPTLVAEFAVELAREDAIGDGLSSWPFKRIEDIHAPAPR
jgi:hypothetical protein